MTRCSGRSAAFAQTDHHGVQVGPVKAGWSCLSRMVVGYVRGNHGHHGRFRLGTRKLEIMTRFEQLLSEVRALDLPADQFAVFGSGPLAAKGLLDRDVNDLDIIVTPALWDELCLKHTPEDHEHGLLRIQIGGLEILNGWYPSVGSVVDLIRDAELIDGVRFVRKEKVLEWKRLRGKDKDKRDIELIPRHFHDDPVDT